jgi:hypothetical protein
MSVGRPTSTERAFELAASGRIASISDLRRALASEGHSSAQVVGPHMLRQLRQLIQQARSRSEGQATSE